MLAATSPATGGDVDRQALKLVPFVGPTSAFYEMPKLPSVADTDARYACLDFSLAEQIRSHPSVNRFIRPLPKPLCPRIFRESHRGVCISNPEGAVWFGSVGLATRAIGVVDEK